MLHQNVKLSLVSTFFLSRSSITFNFETLFYGFFFSFFGLSNLITRKLWNFIWRIFLFLRGKSIRWILRAFWWKYVNWWLLYPMSWRFLWFFVFCKKEWPLKVGLKVSLLFRFWGKELFLKNAVILHVIKRKRSLLWFF